MILLLHIVRLSFLTKLLPYIIISHPENFRRQLMTRFRLSVFILILLFAVQASAREQHGPFLSIFMYPGAYALPGAIPTNNEPIGTVDSNPTEGSEFSSVSSYALGGGYFYDKFMGQLTYSSVSAKEYTTDQSEDSVEEAFDYTLSHFEFTGGLRLSGYGNSSFSYFYGGYRRLMYSTDRLGIDLTGDGFVLGYTGFYSYGAAWDLEFVLYLNGYFGNYPYSEYSAENVTGESEHTQSYCVGASLGAGVQYEPYNVTLLGLVTAEAEQISHNSRIADGWADFGVRHNGLYFGIGVMYQYLNFKYNKVESALF